MIAFIGLGNVESRYANTKHNFGFWVVDELAKRWNITFSPGKGDYVAAKQPAADVLLVKPTSGMNRSGVPVKEIIAWWGVDPENMHIIVDDVDLPLGNLRIRPYGGDGCHKGLESVIYHLRNDRFPRIRMGIGTDEQMRPAEKYVLKPFHKRDHNLAEEMVIKGADAVESILNNGLEKTMTQYNRIQKKETIVG